MVQVNPKKIAGKWREGYVLDFQTLKSEFLGYNGLGHPIFDTTRSEIGELLYRLKYKDDKTVLDAISEVVAEFIKGRKLELDFIVPAPASRTRAFQPVLEIAKSVGSILGLPLCNDCIIKVKNTPQLKNVADYAKRPELLEDAFSADPVKLGGCNLLLFDDLYQSGATLTAMTATAYSEGKAANVYVLALTRTRST